MKPERGNILFLILLAVVLFAALSYAVTQSTNGGGKNASGESNRAKAASILQFFDQLDAAVLRMRMTGGIPLQNISFEYMYKNYGGSPFMTFVNANCTNDACRVFKPDGGGATPRTFEQYAVANPTSWNVAWAYPGYMEFEMGQWPYAGTDLNDIIVQILLVQAAVCDEINNALGITGSMGWTGAQVGQNTPANWDNAAWVISASNPQQLMSRNTFAGAYFGTGADARCAVYHMVAAR